MIRVINYFIFSLVVLVGCKGSKTNNSSNIEKWDVVIEEPEIPQRYILTDSVFLKEIRKKVFLARNKRIKEEIVIVKVLQKSILNNNHNYEKYIKHLTFSDNESTPYNHTYFYSSEMFKTIVNKDKYKLEKNIQNIYLFEIHGGGEQISVDYILVFDNYDKYCKDVYYTRGASGFKEKKVCGWESDDYIYFIDQFMRNLPYSYDTDLSDSDVQSLRIDKIYTNSKNEIEVKSTISTTLTRFQNTIIEKMIAGDDMIEW